MGTLNKRGPYDPMRRMRLDEPLFVLAAHDVHSDALVREWARLRETAVAMGIKPKEDLAQIAEARRLADQMEAWRAKNRAAKKRPQKAVA